MLQVLREQTGGLTLREIIELVLDKSRLIEHYRAEKDGQDRVENLEELVNAAESFAMLEGFGRHAKALPDATAGALSQSPVSQGIDVDGPASAEEAPAADITGEVLSPLLAFLTHAALESGDNQAQAGQEAMQLMTVHAAKGLEFDCVFISGLEEGLFPHDNALSDWDGLEEERRLMYVAITRARKRLYLSHSQTRLLHGQTRYNVKSRFLDELPEPALKFLTPKRNAAMGLPPNQFGQSSFGGNAQGNSYGWQRPWQQNSDATKTRASDEANTGTVSQFAAKNLPKGAPAGLKVGAKVFHNKFGEGQVLTLDGSGDDARAQVSFPRHGTKWLALAIAKLDVL
jgi:DNA helicase-2/ATP-dependent DNA helicase PcrA